jgi:hypothetical protein
MRNKLLAIILSVFSITANSQNHSPGVSRYIFRPEWYVGANTGLNSFWGEGVGGYIRTRPLSTIAIMGRATMGYNFSPVLGIRGMLGYSQHNWAEKTPATTFGAENLTMDVMVNLSNINGSYNLYRPIQFSGFAGLGFTYRNMYNTYPGVVSTFIRGGLQGDYHLTKYIDLNLIGELNILNDKFNGVATGFLFDAYPALTVGLTYHLRGRKK